MAKIRIVGDSSGYVELAAPNAAGNNTLELPSNATKLVGADASNSLNVTGIATFSSGINVGTGASISSPATNVLTLGTNSVERVRIDSSGRVGIATDIYPNSEMLVVDNVNGSNAYNSKFVFSGTTNTAYCASTWTHGQSGTAVGYAGVGGSNTGNASFRNTFVVGTQNANALVLNTNDTERVRIESGGNVKLSTAGTKILNSSGNSILNQTGSILQVVQTVKSDTFTSSTTATWNDITGLSASITPSSTSNKILVICQIVGGSGTNAFLRLVRGSSPICVGDAAGSRVQTSTGSLYTYADGNITNTHIINFLDSPSTISSTTYKIQLWFASTSASINRSQSDGDNNDRNRAVSTITLMEVSA